MAFLLRLLRPRGYRVSLDKNHCSFLYRERGRRVRVPGEAMADGFAVYASSIRQWESSPSDVIDDKERQRIATNIREYFVDRGKNIYIS
jgi:hypothetical protein